MMMRLYGYNAQSRHLNQALRSGVSKSQCSHDLADISIICNNYPSSGGVRSGVTLTASNDCDFPIEAEKVLKIRDLSHFALARSSSTATRMSSLRKIVAYQHLVIMKATQRKK